MDVKGVMLLPLTWSVKLLCIREGIQHLVYIKCIAMRYQSETFQEYIG